MSIITEIKKSRANIFRRLYFKKRNNSGDYETSWTQVENKYIKKWGTISFSIDDVLPSFIKSNDINITVDNSTGKFSDVTESKSIFYNSVTKIRTLVKIEAGYTADDGTEYPTNSTLFVGIITSNSKYKDDGSFDIQISPLTKVFDEIPVDLVSGMGVSQTASNLVTNIKNYTQGGSYIFQKFITSGGWNITATTNNYDMATTSSMQNMGCWEFMNKLAVAENKFVYIDKTGDFYFTEKGVTGTSQFHFSGINDDNKTCGHNIMSTIVVDENIDKVFNRVRITYGTTETSTSTYVKQETWTWGDSSSSYYYGVREFKYQNEWMGVTAATAIANTMYNEYLWPKLEISFDSKFVPQLNVQNTVSITYRSQKYETGDLWNVGFWGSAIWGNRVGYNIYIDSMTTKIISITHNLDEIKSSLVLREL